MNVAAVRNLSLRNFLTCGYTIDVYGKGVGMNAGNNMNNYNSNGNDLNVRVKSGENEIILGCSKTDSGTDLINKLISQVNFDESKMKAIFNGIEINKRYYFGRLWVTKRVLFTYFKH